MIEQRVPLLAFEAEGGEGRHVATRSDTDFEAAAAHQVGDDGILGDADRQFQRQGDDAGAQPDSRRVGGDMGQEHEGGGQSAFALMEMVLGDPGRIEAAFLGMPDLLGGEAVALGCVDLVEQAGEEAEALDRKRGHGLNLGGSSGGPARTGTSRTGRARPGMASISSRV